MNRAGGWGGGDGGKNGEYIQSKTHYIYEIFKEKIRTCTRTQNIFKNIQRFFLTSLTITGRIVSFYKLQAALLYP